MNYFCNTCGTSLEIRAKSNMSPGSNEPAVFFEPCECSKRGIEKIKKEEFEDGYSRGYVVASEEHEEALRVAGQDGYNEGFEEAEAIAQKKADQVEVRFNSLRKAAQAHLEAEARRGSYAGLGN